MKKLFSFILLAATLFILKPTSVQAAGGCDTLFNLTSVMDTPTVIPIDSSIPVIPGISYSGSTGYLSGNNTFNDMIKAEGFGVTPGQYLNSATFYFGVVTLNPADAGMPIEIGVWDNTGTDIYGNTGAPGNMINSTYVSLGEIAGILSAEAVLHEPTGVLVNFFGGPALTTDTIYVGVFLPQAAGDTLALLTNNGYGPDGNGWEFEFNYLLDTNSTNFAADTFVGWGGYNYDWFDTSGSLGNYIVANVCNTPNSTPLLTNFTVSDSIGCSPDTVNFTDATNPPTNYWTWSFGDEGSSMLANPSHVYSSSGVYTVSEISFDVLPAAIPTTPPTPSYILEFYAPASVNITVNQSPGATNNITFASSASATNGSAIVTPDGGTAPYSFAWSNDSTGHSITNVVANDYTVTITDDSGCVFVDHVDVYVTGIMQLSAGRQVKIYPNPTSDLLNLVWSQQSNAEVSIIDMNGNVIHTYITTGATNNVYDVRDLPSGTYVIRITDRSSNEQHSMLFNKI